MPWHKWPWPRSKPCVHTHTHTQVKEYIQHNFFKSQKKNILKNKSLVGPKFGGSFSSRGSRVHGLSGLGLGPNLVYMYVHIYKSHLTFC